MYPGLGKRRWIQEVSEDGTVLMNDGSRWATLAKDRSTILGWDHKDVQVSRAKAGGQGYLIATDTPAVTAEYLGINEYDAV